MIFLPNQLELQTLFSGFLFETGLSAVSIKNYLSDIRHFLGFCSSVSIHQDSPTVQEVFQNITKYLNLYLADQQKSYTPQNTINRRSASIRRFSTFLASKYGLESDLNDASIISKRPSITNQQSKSNEETSLPTIGKILEHFKIFLVKEKKSYSTVKNYISDLNHFFAWSANETPFLDQNLENILSESHLNAYVTYLRLSHTSTSVINRRQSSIKQFTRYSFLQKYIPSNPFEYKHQAPRLLPLSWLERFSSKKNKGDKNASQSHLALWYQKYNSLPFTPYLHLAILVLATSAMVIFGYNQIIKQAAPSSAALPTVPRRQLSFQGRLTDSSATPITTPVDVVFTLFNQLTGGSQLYTTSTCSVDPDQNGIFNSLIGDGTCGLEIDGTVFTNNRDVFLEISIGAETLTPRQQIATVGYALNSETLQGYPASGSATINTVPIVDNGGDINIAASSPSINSTSGTFNINGQALTLTTAANSAGNIVLQPDSIGGGQVQVLGATTTTNTLQIQNANLTSGNLISGYVGNDTAIGRLLSLTSGSSEADRFYVAASGETKINTKATLVNAGLIIDQNGTGDLFTASKAGTVKFTIGNTGNIAATGTLTGLTGLTVGSGTVSLPNGEINTAEISELDWTKLQNYPSTCGAGEVVQAVGDTLTCVSVTSLSGNLWQRTSGSLAPLNITDSINLGATATTSALVHLAGTAAENSWINTGNLGIGLTTPAEKLDVNGGIKLAMTTNTNAGTLRYTTGNNLEIYDGTYWAVLNTGKDTKEITGFVDRTTTSLSFTNTSPDRTFTITGTNFPIYLKSELFTKNTETIQIADTVGLHYIYYNSAGTLVEDVNAWDLSSAVPIATVYWNGATGLIGDERHGISMDWATHEYLHKTVGTRYDTGLGGAFTNTTFSIDPGSIYDEDLKITITPAKTTTRVLYRIPAATSFTYTAAQTAYYTASTGVLDYDNAGTRTAVPANNYVAYWIFATDDPTTPIYSLMGQRIDGNLTNARNNNTYQALSLANLPFAEMKILYRVLVRNAGGTATYIETQDQRNISNLPAGTFLATAHGTLTGLLNDDHTQYALLAGRTLGQVLIGGDTADETLTLQGNSGASGNTATSANLIFKVGNSGNTTAMTILNNGNVGIGITNPSAVFQVNGTVTTAGGNISFNNDSNFTTNINTGTSTGAVTIGGNSNTVAVNSSNWDVSTAGAASGLTGISSSGDIDFSSLSAGGLVKAAVTTGRLGIASSGTDYELPLTFSNGLTRSTNAVTLGGTLTGTTDIPLAGFDLTFSSLGNVGIGLTNPTAKLDVAGSVNIQGYATASGSLAVGYTNAPEGPGHAIFKGLVGIGLTNPTTTLDVTGTGRFSSTLTASNGFTVTTGTVSLPNGEINTAEISELDWTKLQNYPSTCGAGEVVQAVGDTLTCVNVAAMSGNLWQRTDGSLAPINITDSLNLGATATSSALVHLAGTAAENSWINTGNFGIGTTTPGDLLGIIQTTTTGSALEVSRNLDSASSNSSVVNLIQDNSGDDQNVLSIQNDGTGYGIGISNNSTATGLRVTQGASAINRALSVYSNVDDTSASPLVDIITDNVAFDQSVLNVDNDGTGNAINIVNDGTGMGLRINQNGTGNALNIYSNVDDTAVSPMVNIVSDNVAYDQTLFRLQQDGAADIVNIFDATTEVFSIIDGGSVGIGATAPVEKLQVAGAIKTTGAATTNLASSGTLDFQGGGTNIFSNGANSSTNGTFSIYIQGSDGTGQLRPFFVKGDGNIGIGTTTPLRNLHINAAAAEASLILSRADGLANNKNWRIYTDGTAGTANNLNIDLLNDAGSSVTTSLATFKPTGDIILSPNGGNVGIGDTTPSSRLDVAGSVNIQGYATASSSLAVGYTNAPEGPGHAIFKGFVGIGLTNPAYNLDVVGDVNITGALRDNTDAGDAGQILSSTGTGVEWIDVPTTGTNYWQLNDGAVTPANITNSLNLGNAATASATVHLAGTAAENSWINTGNFGIGDTTPAALFTVGSGDLFTVNSSGIIDKIDNVAHTIDDVSGNLTFTSAGTSVMVADDLGVNGATSADITSSTTTATVFDTTVTTLSMGGAATTLNLGTTDSVTRAINLGTGTGVDTINIGTGGTGADVINIGSANAGNVTIKSNAVLNLTGAANSLIDFPNFDVATTGNITTAGDAAINGGNITATGDLTLNPAGGDVFLGASDNLGITAATNLIFGTTTSLGETTAADDSGAYLVGVYDEFDYSNGANVQAVLNDLDAQLALTTNYWQLNDGAVTPKNITNSLNLGNAATASATVHLAGTTGENSWINTGNFGIGTTAPLTLTEIQGGLTTTGAVLTLSSKETSTVLDDILGRIDFRAALDASGTDAILTGASIAAIAENTFSSSVNETGLQFSTGASEAAVERMRIDHHGNVGIGTTAPASGLQVSNGGAILGSKTLTANSQNDVILFSDAAGTKAQSGTYYNKLKIFGGNSAVRFLGLYQTTSGAYIDSTWDDLKIITSGNNADIYLTPNGTGDVLINSGNLGIGKTNPATALDVVGVGTFSTGLTLSSGALNLTSTSGAISATALGASTISATSNNLTLSTVTSGTLALTSAGALNLSAGAASTWTLPSAVNALNIDSNTLTIDAQNNRVGIGLTNPAEALVVAGNIFPSASASYDLGGSTTLWSSLFLDDGIYHDSTQMIAIDSSRLAGGSWFVASGGLKINTTTAFSAFENANDIKLVVNGSATIAGNLSLNGGTGKLDVGTIDPPYTINGNKYATYVASVIGVKEEVVGNVITQENNYIEGLGFRTLIDLDQQPIGSDIWLFSKTTDIKKHINNLSVLLTPEGQAKVWYEIDKENKILAIYSSTPTNITYRLTAPRFDSENWQNTRPASDINTGYVINDPNIYENQNSIFDNPVTSPELIAKIDGTYSLKINGTENKEVSSFMKSIIANLKAGAAVVSNLVADNLTVQTKLISPLADIDQLKVIDATISGTLYADNIKGQTIDSLHSQINLLDEKYSTASGILAELQARYSTYNSLLTATSAASIFTDPLALSPLATTSASIPQDLALNSLLVNTDIFTNSLSSFDTDLFIQPTADKPVHLLANLMTLYPDGKVLINGDLLITGTLFAQGIDTQTATVSGSLAVGSSTIASESARFAQLTTDGLIIATGNDSQATISGQTNSNATIGTANILSGTNEVSILNSKVTSTTLIYITPTSDTAGRVLFVKSKTTGLGFTVGLTGDTNTPNTSFNYWLVETK